MSLEESLDLEQKEREKEGEKTEQSRTFERKRKKLIKRVMGGNKQVKGDIRCIVRTFHFKQVPAISV